MSLDISRLIVSNICRVEPTVKMLELILAHGPGKIQLPTDVLRPRQIRFTQPSEADASIVRIRWHRDGLEPVLSTKLAAAFVAEGDGEYVDQFMLVYSREDYLADSDVKANQEEFTRVSESPAEFVLVAIIGENRSMASVLRNIVSGCQNMETLVQDAQAAIDSRNVFLIED